ncbi:MAG: hypothetical protein ACNS60_19510 [Candidatus Cyclobacteriaceae bacterium M2_1C_046]
MLKFIAGPTLGYAAGFSYLTTVLVTVLGMMSSVFLFTMVGKLLREKVVKKYLSPRKKFTKRSRRFVKIWQKYGEIGVAVLTPVIFTPIGGTLMLASAGTKKRKVIIYMLFSSVFWAFVITAFIYLFGDNLNELVKEYTGYSIK